MFELDEFPVFIVPGFLVNWPILSLFGFVGGFVWVFFFLSRDFLVPVFEANSAKLVYFYFMLFCWHGISLSVFVL